MSIRQYWPISEDDVYVRLFNEILREVDASFFEPKFVAGYGVLVPEAKYLITRMYLRTPKWIRFEDFVNYMAPETLKQVLPTLVEQGWLLATPPLSALIADVATLTELQALAKALGMKTTKRTRPKLALELIELSKQQSHFKQSNRTAELLPIECYFLAEPRRRFLFELEQNFLYPAGPDATLQFVLLKHMKKQSYLPYEYYTQKERPLFTRDEFTAYVAARELALPIELAVDDRSLQAPCVTEENLQKLEGLLSNAVSNVWRQATYTLGRSIYNVSQIFMKQHRFHDEYSWILKYLDQTTHRSKRGVALIRKLQLEIRFLSESGTTGVSSWLISAVNTFHDAQEECNEIEVLDLQRKMPKLLAAIKACGLQSALPFIPSTVPARSLPVVHVVAVPVKTELQNKQKQTPAGTRVVYENNLNVEQLAMEQYADFQSGHFEGSIITTIFWLLSYDLLFSNKADFRCAYQSVPLHLQQCIDANADRIKSRIPSIAEHLVRNRRSIVKLGEPLPRVGSINWYIAEQSVLSILKGLSEAQIEKILCRLMSNYSKYSSGFPDLTLWNDARTKFVEVKSENDTISDNQQRWMEFLLEHGVETEICKISARPAKRKRSA